MGPVFFVLAIMGCGEDGGACTAARTERYATAAQCQAALPAALARHADLDFPSLSASCRRNGPVTIAAVAARRPSRT